MTTFSRPPLTQLISRIKNDIKQAVSASEPFKRGLWEYATARAFGYTFHSAYGFIAWAYDQLFWDTANDTNFWRIANFFGVFQNEADAWAGVYEFTTTGAATIPSGTALTSTTGGRYLTTTAVSAGSAGTYTANITADVGYEGSAFQLDSGAPLTLESPIANVNSAGEVVVTVNTGSDLETRVAATARLLSRTQDYSGVGTAADYSLWAKLTPGVTRAAAYYIGSGIVNVYCVRDGDWDGAEGDAADIIPSAGELTAIQANLDDNAILPITPVAVAPSLVELDLTLELTPSDTTTVEAVRANLIKYLNTLDIGSTSTIEQSVIDEAISTAVGEESHNITTSTPVFPISLEFNEVIQLGTLTVT